MYLITSALAEYSSFGNLEFLLPEIKVSNFFPILDDVGIESCYFGEIVTIIRPIPSFKLLRSGLISELKVTIMDEYGKAINNNGQPITVVLQILKNEHLWRINYHNGY